MSKGDYHNSFSSDPFSKKSFGSDHSCVFVCVSKAFDYFDHWLIRSSSALVPTLNVVFFFLVRSFPIPSYRHRPSPDLPTVSLSPNLSQLDPPPLAHPLLFSQKKKPTLCWTFTMMPSPLTCPTPFPYYPAVRQHHHRLTPCRPYSRCHCWSAAHRTPPTPSPLVLRPSEIDEP